MNKKIYVARNAVLRQKKFYLALITIMLLGFISGIVFMFFIDKDSKKTVLDGVNLFFKQIKSSEGINYSKSFINTFFSNIGYALLIWVLGISIIGLPIIVLVLFFKSFVLGFSIASIVSNYGFKGVLGAFLYAFPHYIVLLIVYLLLGFYSIMFCYKLFMNLFLKKNNNLRINMTKYLKVLGFSLIIILITSLYEVFLSTYFMKLFTLTI